MTDLHLAHAKAGICALFFCFMVWLTGSKLIMGKKTLKYKMKKY